jgi:hypothetical protein
LTDGEAIKRRRRESSSSHKEGEMRAFIVSVAALVAGLLTFANVATSQEAANAHAQAASRAEKILADQTLFAPEFAERVRKVMPLVASGGVRSFGLAVPADRQPRITDIKSKYGPPEKVDEAPRGPSGPGLPEPPIDTRYTYGPLRFCVPKTSATGRVEFLTVVPLK